MQTSWHHKHMLFEAIVAAFVASDQSHLTYMFAAGPLDACGSQRQTNAGAVNKRRSRATNY